MAGTVLRLPSQYKQRFPFYRYTRNSRHLRKSIKCCALFDERNPYAALNQLLEADMVYVRDFTQPQRMSDEQLKHLAIIAHHCYRSFNLATNCILHLCQRQAIAANSMHGYAALAASVQTA